MGRPRKQEIDEEASLKRKMLFHKIQIDLLEHKLAHLQAVKKLAAEAQPPVITQEATV